MAQPFTHEDQLKGGSVLTSEHVSSTLWPHLFVLIGAHQVAARALKGSGTFFMES